MDDHRNDLSPARVLKASQNVFPLAVEQEVDSTNARMKAWARGEGGLFPSDALPALLIADRQTAGRGRLGRSFHSPGSTGLYMTLALPRAADDAPPLTVAAAVAVCQALEMHGVTPAVKWVNDIFVRHQKVCGILAEMVGDVVLIGIGVNVRSPEDGFPEDIRAIAGALDIPVRRDTLAGEIAGRLIDWSRNVDNSHLIEEYTKRMPLIGREIEYRRNETVYRAKVIGIDRLGGLIIKHQSGAEEILRVGEITIGSGNAPM